MFSHISIENNCLIYKLLDFNTLNINKMSINSKLYLDENVKNKTLFTLFNPRVMFLPQQVTVPRIKVCTAWLKASFARPVEKKFGPKKLKVWHGPSKFLQNRIFTPIW